MAKAKVLKKGVPDRAFRVDIHRGVPMGKTDYQTFAVRSNLLELEKDFKEAVEFAEKECDRTADFFSVQVVQVLYQQNVFSLPG